VKLNLFLGIKPEKTKCKPNPHLSLKRTILDLEPGLSACSESEVDELTQLSRKEFHMHMIWESPRVICLAYQSPDSLSSGDL